MSRRSFAAAIARRVNGCRLLGGDHGAAHRRNGAAVDAASLAGEQQHAGPASTKRARA
jgi:hypothetical protein